jgi:tungstate transport system substrate-binding protein
MPTNPPDGVLRLAAVNTPEYSGLLDDLNAEFQRQSGWAVEVWSGEDVYERARAGNADIVISHYGHGGLQRFIEDGLGQWPLTVFSNQMALVGPAEDPACVRGLLDVVEAFRRIAATQSLYIFNRLQGAQYLMEIVREAAADLAWGTWYHDPGVRGNQAMDAAAELGAYAIWGAFPFLRYRQHNPAVNLEPLVLGDPLLQRMMVATVVRADAFPDAKVEAAGWFQQYLLTPATQARIRSFRVPGVEQALWWPAGRNNNPSVFPR